MTEPLDRLAELRHRHYTDRQANFDVPWLVAELFRLREHEERLRALADEYGDGVSPECSQFADRLREVLGDEQ